MLSDRKFPRRHPAPAPKRSRRLRPALDRLEGRQLLATSPVSLGYAIGTGGATTDIGNAVATDNAGNTYVTGYFTGTVDFDPGQGTTNLVGDSSRTSAYVAKYDNAGNLVWAEPILSTGTSDVGTSVAVSPTGDVFATGTFKGTANFGNGVTLPGGSDITAYIAHYNPAGQIVSAVQLGGTGTAHGLGIAVDASNNAYITGYYTGTIDFDPTAGTDNLTAPGGGAQSFVMKLNAGGTLGWVDAYGSSGDIETGSGIAVDPSGDVYATGSFVNSVNFGSNIVLTSGGSGDAYVVKLDNAGNTLWAKAPGGSGKVQSLAIAVDHSGDVYTAGYFQGTNNFNPAAGTALNLTAPVQDAYFWKLDPSGNVIWARQLGGASDRSAFLDSASALAVDDAGNLYATGSFGGTVTYGAGGPSLTANGSFDTFALKLDPAGNYAWGTNFDGTSPAANQGNGIAVSTTGGVDVVGSFTNTVNFNPGPGTTNLTSNGQADAYLVKLVSSPVTVDNFDPGYAETGTWSSAAGGSGGTYRFAASSGQTYPTATATWATSGLTPGTYDVAITWVPYSNRATNAVFIVYDGATEVGRVTVDETKAPTGTTVGGVTYQSLGAFPTFTGTLRVAVGNNANNYVIADAARFSAATPTPAIVDNDSPSGYVEAGPWTSAGGGNNQDYRYAAGVSGAATSTASWTTSGLSTGFYDVEATWVPYSNRATNAPYSIYDGTKLLATVLVNQQLAPTGPTSNGVAFQSLGVFRSTTGTLRVVLGNNANNYVVADATRVATASTGPVNIDNDDPNFSVGAGWTPVAGRGGVNNDYLYAAPSTSAPFTTATWSTAGLAPGAYSVLTTWTPYANRASNAPYSIYDGNTLLATIPVDQRLNPQGTSIGGITYQSLGTFQINSGMLRVVLTNAADNYVVADSVFVQTATSVVDDSDPVNYTQAGTWTGAGGGGLNGDYRFAAPGNGSSTAVWQVAVPTVGASYDVQVTWVPYFNRATNATYQVFDGNTLLSSVTVNQQLSPTGPLYNGIPFQSLGVFTSNTGTLRVVLTNAANGYVIADAIKVDYVNVGGNSSVP